MLVTESGIATAHDERRIAYIEAALREVQGCLADGIDVRSYLYWSWLDNFEWGLGLCADVRAGGGGPADVRAAPQAKRRMVGGGRAEPFFARRVRSRPTVRARFASRGGVSRGREVERRFAPLSRTPLHPAFGICVIGRSSAGSILGFLSKVRRPFRSCSTSVSWV